MVPINTIVFLIVITVFSIVIIKSLKGKGTGLKRMLLGIHVTLLGGIVVADPSSNLGGIEYLVALLGLGISISGLGDDNA